MILTFWLTNGTQFPILYVYFTDCFTREGQENDDLNSRILSTFLNELDGITGENCGDEGGVLVVVTCSSIEVLDDALTRPGRLHQHFYLGFPTADDMIDILALKMHSIPRDADASAENILASLPQIRRTGSDIAGLCGRAVEYALREAIRGNCADNINNLRVCLRHFVDVSDNDINF
jgi:SpoVK/Ycf46/Vps4 family AAA+-type ATPase